MKLKYLCLSLLVFINHGVICGFSSKMEALLTPSCDQWVLGYSTESCALTCSRISGVCNASEFHSIVSPETFYNMVASSHALCTNEATGTADQFCNQRINSPQLAQTPIAFTYRSNGGEGVSEQPHCSYPTSEASVVADCDAQYVYPPAQRFCPCTVSCDSPSSPPSTVPSATPSTVPISQPSLVPSTVPSQNPSAGPTFLPVPLPTTLPSPDPTALPSKLPTALPSPDPTALPSAGPTALPTELPTALPSAGPTALPSKLPTALPSAGPTALPSKLPTALPSAGPTALLSKLPTALPSAGPTALLSKLPTALPSAGPTTLPSKLPAALPSAGPSASHVPSLLPTYAPTYLPTKRPTALPTASPSEPPTIKPSAQPSCTPTCTSSLWPTANPSKVATTKPTATPSNALTAKPTTTPSNAPTAKPTVTPSNAPTTKPTVTPSNAPTTKPTAAPSDALTTKPTTTPSNAPTTKPTVTSSNAPTAKPSVTHSDAPTTKPTTTPSLSPIAGPTYGSSSSSGSSSTGSEELRRGSSRGHTQSWYYSSSSGWIDDVPTAASAAAVEEEDDDGGGNNYAREGNRRLGDMSSAGWSELHYHSSLPDNSDAVKGHCVDVPVHLRWWYKESKTADATATACLGSPTITFNEGAVQFPVLGGDEDFWVTPGQEIPVGYAGAVVRSQALDTIVLTDVKIQFSGMECSSFSFSIALPDQIIPTAGTNTSSNYIALSFHSIVVVPSLCGSSSAMNLKHGGIFSAKVRTCGDAAAVAIVANHRHLEEVSETKATDTLLQLTTARAGLYEYGNIWSGYVQTLFSSVTLPTMLILSVVVVCTAGGVVSLWAGITCHLPEHPSVTECGEAPPSLASSPLSCIVVHRTLSRSGKSNPFSSPSTVFGSTGTSHLPYSPSHCTTS